MASSTTRTSLQLPAGSSTKQTTLPSLAALSDPPTRYIDSAAMDYFLIELVNTLRESSAVATAKSKKIEQEMIEAGLIPPPTAPPKVEISSPKSSPKDSTTSLNSTSRSGTSGKASGPVDEEEEALRARLEGIGLHVGANFAERLSRDKTMFTETLDAIKFICKDLWSACWNKQVDNLRTNHRGVYVLQDNAFHTIARVSSWQGRAEAIKRAKIYAAMPAGIIKGALTRMGYSTVTVTPEISSLPQCTFQVKIPRSS